MPTVFPVIGYDTNRHSWPLNSADVEFNYEGWNFNSGNYLFTTDTK